MFRRDIEEIRGTFEAGRYSALMNLSQILNQGHSEDVDLSPVAESASSEEPESDFAVPLLELRSPHRNVRANASVTTPQISRVIRRLMLERRRLQRQITACENPEPVIDPMEVMKSAHKAIENYLLQGVFETEAEMQDPVNRQAKAFVGEIFYSTVSRK